MSLNVVRDSVFWMRLVRSFHWQETVNEIVLDSDCVPLLCDIYGVMELCDIYGILVNDNNPVSLLYRIWLHHNIKYVAQAIYVTFHMHLHYCSCAFFEA